VAAAVQLFAICFFVRWQNIYCPKQEDVSKSKKEEPVCALFPYTAISNFA
jgi:hypothetical protein